MEQQSPRRSCDIDLTKTAKSRAKLRLVVINMRKKVGGGSTFKITIVRKLQIPKFKSSVQFQLKHHAGTSEISDCF